MYIIYIYELPYMRTSGLVSVAKVFFINIRPVLLTAYLPSSPGHPTCSAYPKQNSLHPKTISPHIIRILMNGPTIDLDAYANNWLLYFPSFILIFYILLITNFGWLCLFSSSCIFSYILSPLSLHCLIQRILSRPGSTGKWKIRYGYIYKIHSWSSQNVEWKNKLQWKWNN